MDVDQLKPPSLVPAGPAAPPPPAVPAGMSEPDEERVAIGEIVAVTLEYKWLIATICVLALVAGLAWIVLARPLYRADGLLQVEEKSSNMPALRELQPLLGDETTVAAELEILGSRMILGRVVEKLKLNIEASPDYFPLIGNAVARRFEGPGLNTPWFGLTGFAWGGEVLQVDALDVPRSLLNEKLTLVVGMAGSFELFDDSDTLLLHGRTGERASDRGVSIFVPRLDAHPGTRFVLRKRSNEAAIDSLRNLFSVKERGKKSGVLEASLLGEDPARIGLVLNDIFNTYLRQNVDRRSAHAENTLKFLENQLPSLKHELDNAEAAYNGYRQSRGSLDLTTETQSVLQSIVEVDNQIVALKQERDELRQNFTPEHPRIQAVDNKLDRLRERRRQFDAEVARLPDTQQTVLRLARDVEVTTTLYTDLLNTAQQLRVSKAGAVGDVRIIDPAVVASQPVGLKPPAILTISGVLGLLAGFVSAWGLRSLKVVVEDPDQIESALGLPVYATIPHSTDEVAIVRRARKTPGGELLAVTRPEDDAVESLRGLRTTIHFALLDAHRNSLLITGPSPGLGKSFVSKNLGAVLAQSGQRVVLIDADLRRGHLNKEFGLPREIGVSDYVSGTAALEQLVKPTAVPNLSVVTTGQIPPNPSELLMHLRFETLLEKLGAQYDILIIDAPPVLAVSDAAIIGRHTGATLMVARAGRHPIRELEQAVKRLNHAGVQVKGFVFNDLNTTRQRYRYGYQGYVYRYSYKSKS